MLNIIHVSSSGRSGSTLLNILLGNYKEVFAGAELFRYSRLWTREQYIACADGTKVKESDFWKRVKEPLNEQCENIEEDAIVPEHVPVFISAILKESKTRIVCDTSKSRKYTRVIYDERYFRPFIIHLVRDGRAVVFSTTGNDPTVLEILKTGLIWCVGNIQVGMRNRKNDNYLCVRYEDLIFDFENVVDEIERKIENYFSLNLSKSAYDSKRNTGRFAFAGNRMRESFDGVIEYDSRYITQQSNRWAWTLLTLLMAPALLFFKYPMRRDNCKKVFS